ncbi:MerR family transcriptional regulator [Sanguibacter sp. HDW7]|uniref:MerR family transcriptional regulator n=1 Tax=Sanguibacter sp. HDW7 TaxID=2714931 RepID=UPI00140CCF48|nr:MerR family transcriptional regulator [Sanguibacter sp. HDW7]QIK82352.1 MerR family transcriptional regulator [Sanguibacter sp. HDW7]
MPEPLLSIGSFARAVGLSPTTLRHYDDVDLLAPAHVDGVSGYRFYDVAQVRTARMLAALRDASVPVETMRAVVDADDGAVGALLEELAARRTTSAAAEAAALRRLAGELAVPRRAVATVDGAHLAVALAAVAPLAGADELDAVQVVVGDGLVLLASDRVRLARWSLDATVRATSGGSSVVVTVPGPDVPALAGWARDRAKVTVTADEHGATFADGSHLAPVAADASGAAPDLAAVWEARRPRGLNRTWVAPEDGPSDARHVAVPLGDVEVLLDSALLDGALATVHGPAMLEADTNLEPVLVRSAATPQHGILLMPVVPEGLPPAGGRVLP